MTRLAVTVLLANFILAGCAGPIETRVQTQSSFANLKPQSFQYSTVKAPNPEMTDFVELELGKALNKNGLVKSTQASVLVNYSIADRPGSIAIQLGEGETARTITSAKEKKPFQSCEDREHRFVITMIDRETGNQLYRGTASEFHCKANPRQSIPYLVKAALSDFNGQSGGAVNNKILKRRGLD